MGIIESVIWHTLGYLAIPAVLLGGFLATAVAAWLLILYGQKSGRISESDSTS